MTTRIHAGIGCAVLRPVPAAMTPLVREVERSVHWGMVRRRGASASGPLSRTAEDGAVMPTDTPLAAAVRSETAAPYAATGAASPSSETWTLLTKVETSCDRILIAGGANVEAEWEQGPAV